MVKELAKTGAREMDLIYVAPVHEAKGVAGVRILGTDAR